MYPSTSFVAQAQLLLLCALGLALLLLSGGSCSSWRSLSLLERALFLRTLIKGWIGNLVFFVIDLLGLTRRQ